MTVERQGWGDFKEGLGAPLRRLLETRTGVPTIIRLADGKELVVKNVAWGRDFGDFWEHITTNTAPPHDLPIHFLHLSEIESVRDPVTGKILIAQEPRPGET